MFKEPLIMGILNVTPDSSSDGGRFFHPENALNQVENLLRAGADLIDVGGASSRPGAALVTPEAEIQRVIPVIQKIRKEFPDTIISLDTWRAEVSRQGLAEGVHLINDISAGRWEPEILRHTAEANAPYLLMHCQGKPETMQLNPEYADVTEEVFQFLMQRIQVARAAGIRDVLIDPGFGFGKSLSHNFTLVKNLSRFILPGIPLAVGYSKKSMLTHLTGKNKEEVRELSTVLHYKAMEAGALCIRVHEPAPVVQARTLFKYLNHLSA